MAVKKEEAKSNVPATPAKFGPTYPGSYPSEMRTQMWPLCCGARIISGFKAVHTMSVEEIVQQVADVLQAVPDHQIFAGEQFKPHFTFLTLNSFQMASDKIMDAVGKAGFIKIGVGRPRGSDQGFYLLDTSKTWKAA